MATSPTLPKSIEEAAGVTLAWIHTRQCLPFLVQLLDDPNFEIQAAGVGGLAMFANNVPIRQTHPAPGPWKYRTDDTIAIRR